MKNQYKLSILAVFALLGLTNTNAQIAYFKFDGNAQDSSASSNQVTVFGTTSAEDRFGRPDHCYAFDGASYIQFNNALQEIKGASNLTIAAWILPQSTKQISIFSHWVPTYFYPGTSCGIILGINTNSQLYINYRSESDVTTATYPLTLNNWSYITLVYDGTALTNKVSVYVNGEIVPLNYSNASLIPSQIADIATQTTIIGGRASQFGVLDKFVGKIDDVKIFKSSISSDQVMSFYNAEKGAVLALDFAVSLRSSNLTSGQTYQVQKSIDLQTWDNDGSPFVAISTNWVSDKFWPTSGQPKTFFRLKLIE